MGDFYTAMLPWEVNFSFVFTHSFGNEFYLFFAFLLALSLPLGKTTVMHLVAREHLPEPDSQGKFIFCLNLAKTFFSKN